MQRTFAVDIYCYDDGKLVARSDDIRELVLETDNYPDMRDELVRVATQLLKANLGLTDDQIADTTLSVAFRDAPGRKSAQALVPVGPRLVMRDDAFRAAARSSSLGTLFRAVYETYLQPLDKPLSDVFRFLSAAAGSSVFFLGTYVYSLHPRKDPAQDRSPDSKIDPAQIGSQVTEDGSALISSLPVQTSVYVLMSLFLVMIYGVLASATRTSRGPVSFFLTGLLLPTLSVLVVRFAWSP